MSASDPVPNCFEVPHSHVPETCTVRAVSVADSVPYHYGVSAPAALPASSDMRAEFSVDRSHVPAASTVHDRDADEHYNNRGKNEEGEY